MFRAWVTKLSIIRLSKQMLEPAHNPAFWMLGILLLTLVTSPQDSYGQQPDNRPTHEEPAKKDFPKSDTPTAFGFRSLRTLIKHHPPKSGAQIQIYNSDGFLLGRAYRLPTNKEIYAISRHILESGDLDSLRREFGDFQIYDLVNKSSQTIDLSLLMASSSRLRPGASLEGIEVKSILTDLHPRIPKQADLWSSWQLGSSGLDAFSQISSGIVLRTSNDQLKKMWLSNTFPNFTSPGGSGSLVWIGESSQENRQNWSWQFSGVIECLKFDLSSHENPPEAQVISVIELLESRFKKSSLELIQANPLKKDPTCIPIGRRGKGGD